MTTTVLSRYDIDVQDIEYLRHGDKPLLARVYKPRGTGPFPLILDVHGGAWCKKDRTADAASDEALARSGVVVVALDFRMGREGRYPASLADINYAIRWSKLRAADSAPAEGTRFGARRAWTDEPVRRASRLDRRAKRAQRASRGGKA